MFMNYKLKLCLKKSINQVVLKEIFKTAVLCKKVTLKTVVLKKVIFLNLGGTGAS